MNVPPTLNPAPYIHPTSGALRKVSFRSCRLPQRKCWGWPAEMRIGAFMTRIGFDHRIGEKCQEPQTIR